MRKISYVELEGAVRGARGALEGARLAKFFEVAPGVFRLKFNSRQLGEVNVVVDVSFGAFLASRVPPSPEAPTQFAAALRSRVDNAILRGVALVNEDRVLRFDLEKKEKFALVFEFVGKGNALLLDAATGKIVFVWKPAVFSSRKLALRENYCPPPAGGKAPKEEKIRSNAELELEYWARDGELAPEKKVNHELAALEKSLEAQREALVVLEKEEREALAAGNWVKENRDSVEEIVASAKNNDVAALKKRGGRKEGAFVEFEA